VKPACRARIVQKEGAGFPGIRKHQHRLPRVREARRVDCGVGWRYRCLRPPTGGKPAKDFGGFATTLDLRDESPKRLGDGALVE
jgi:hypothetical protein